MPTMQEALDVIRRLTPSEREHLKRRLINGDYKKNFYTILEGIRKCPALYLGKVSLIRLQSFLHGYLAAFDDFQAGRDPEKLFPLPFWLFNAYISSRYPSHGGEAGWGTILLDEYGTDDKKSFDAFYARYDEFTALRAKSCRKVRLGQQNIAFLTADAPVPHRVMIRKGPGQMEPFYKNPSEIYWIELTNDAGHLCFVHEDDRNVLEDRIFPNKQGIREYAEAYFGKLSAWEKVEEDIFDLPTKWETIRLL